MSLEIKVPKQLLKFGYNPFKSNHKERWNALLRAIKINGWDITIFNLSSLNLMSKHYNIKVKKRIELDLNLLQMWKLINKGGKNAIRII